MNAYELADKLENYFDSDYDEIVTMLRQQADRIAELEKFIKAILKKGGCDGNICKRYSTHQVKQLSDEEIFAIAEKCYGHSYGLYGNHIGFARAIIEEITE